MNRRWIIKKIHCYRKLRMEECSIFQILFLNKKDSVWYSEMAILVHIFHIYLKIQFIIILRLVEKNILTYVCPLTFDGNSFRALVLFENKDQIWTWIKNCMINYESWHNLKSRLILFHKAIYFATITLKKLLLTILLQNTF